MERICLNGRQVPGFALGDASSDPCTAWPFQGLFGYTTELPVLKAEDEQSDQYMKSLNTALTGPCPSMRDVDKVAWTALYQKWQTLHAAIQDFLASPRLTGIWQGYKVMAAEYMCRIAAIRKQADDYQSKGITQCDPKTIPNAPPPPEPPHKDTDKKDDWLGTVKTVAGTTAVIVAVAGGVYLVYKATEYLPPPKAKR
jgi:hypothetical protein